MNTEHTIVVILIIQACILLVFHRRIGSIEKRTESLIAAMEVRIMKHYDEHHKLLVRCKQSLDRLHDKHKSVWWKSDN